MAVDSDRFAGLSIEAESDVSTELTLVLGAARATCNLELDHPDYAINGGTLDAVDTVDCWLGQLAQLLAGHGPVVLLPFDFSDQYTGWLRVAQLSGGAVEVQAGWSGVDQYSLEPADLLTPQKLIHDFKPKRELRIELPLADLIADVTAAREVVAHWEQFAETRSDIALKTVRAWVSGQIPSPDPRHLLGDVQSGRPQ
jgi:hypothetical protein